jgi:hypothetical protein
LSYRQSKITPYFKHSVNDKNKFFAKVPFLQKAAYLKLGASWGFEEAYLLAKWDIKAKNRERTSKPAAEAKEPKFPAPRAAAKRERKPTMELKPPRRLFTDEEDEVEVENDYDDEEVIIT